MTEEPPLSLVAEITDRLTGFSGLGPLVRAVQDERSRRISLALKAAEQASNRSREDLETWAQSTPETLSLTVRVLLAAGSSGNDDTLRILGGLLAEAADYPERSSEQEIIVAALDGLTREQLIVLSSVPNEVGEQVSDVELKVAGRVTASLIEPVLVGLFVRGLTASPYGGWGDTTWKLSPLGRSILDAAARLEVFEQPKERRRPER